LCVGCRRPSPKKELARLVRTPEGRVEYDPTGKASGRGAYVCRNPRCLEAAAKSGAIEKALGCPLNEDVFESLRKEIGAG